MGVGRKQLPLQLKVLKGTAQKCRINKQAPAVSTELPIPGEFLSLRARQIFDTLVVRIDTMRYASDSHSEMLSILAMRLEEVERYSKIIQEQGHTYEAKVATRVTKNKKSRTTTTVKQIKPRPEVAMLAEASRHAQSLLSEFGLSPASMGKITVAKAGKESKWGKLRQGQG